MDRKDHDRREERRGRDRHPPCGDDRHEVGAPHHLAPLPVLRAVALLLGARILVSGPARFTPLTIDKHSDQFKVPFNTIRNEPKVYTPADTAIVTPNKCAR